MSEKVDVSKFQIKSFEINRKGNKKDKLILSSLHNSDLYSILKNKMHSLTSKVVIIKQGKQVYLRLFSNRIIEIDKERAKTDDQYNYDIKDFVYETNDKGRLIFGMFNFGVIGEEVFISDAVEDTTNKTNENQALLKSFILALYIPKNSKKGYIVCQATHAGVVAIVYSYITQTILQEIDSQYIIDFKKVLPIDYVKNILSKGDVSHLTISHYTIPNEISEKIKNEYFEKNDKYSIDVTINATNSFSKALNKALEKSYESGNFNILEEDDDCEDDWWLAKYDTLRVVVNGMNINLNKPNNINFNPEISLPLDDNNNYLYKDIINNICDYIRKNVDPTIDYENKD